MKLKEFKVNLAPMGDMNRYAFREIVTGARFLGYEGTNEALCYQGYKLLAFYRGMCVIYDSDDSDDIRIWADLPATEIPAAEVLRWDATDWFAPEERPIVAHIDEEPYTSPEEYLYSGIRELADAQGLRDTTIEAYCNRLLRGARDIEHGEQHKIPELPAMLNEPQVAERLDFVLNALRRMQTAFTEKREDVVGMLDAILAGENDMLRGQEPRDITYEAEERFIRVEVPDVIARELIEVEFDTYTGVMQYLCGGSVWKKFGIDLHEYREV